jgi:hypothetical protein
MTFFRPSLGAAPLLTGGVVNPQNRKALMASRKEGRRIKWAEVFRVAPMVLVWAAIVAAVFAMMVSSPV